MIFFIYIKISKDVLLITFGIFCNSGAKREKKKLNLIRKLND